MNKFQWIYLSIAILLLIYVFFKMNETRRIALYGTNNFEPFITINRSMFNPFIDSETRELNYIKRKDKVKIVNTQDTYTNEKLKEYVIKGSSNSIITGEYANLDMIPYLSERGCRFFDLEVLYVDNKPMVGRTKDKKYEFLDSDNTVLLDNVLTSIVTNGFTSKSPNPKDPIFIHLRVKSKNKQIYKDIGKSVDFTLKEYLYNQPVTPDTKLSDLMGKVVLIIDKRFDTNYTDFAACKAGNHSCYNLVDYINLESGTNNLLLNTHNEIVDEKTIALTQKQDCQYCTNIEQYRMAIPNEIASNSKNPELKKLIMDHGIQIILCEFHKNDEYLDKYEEFFDEHKSAFVPLLHAINYFTTSPL